MLRASLKIESGGAQGRGGSLHVFCLSSQSCSQVASPAANHPRTSYMDIHGLDFLPHLHTGTNQSLLSWPASLHLHEAITFCGFCLYTPCLPLFSPEPSLGCLEPHVSSHLIPPITLKIQNYWFHTTNKETGLRRLSDVFTDAQPYATKREVAPVGLTLRPPGFTPCNPLQCCCEAMINTQLRRKHFCEVGDIFLNHVLLVRLLDGQPLTVKT